MEVEALESIYMDEFTSERSLCVVDCASMG